MFLDIFQEFLFLPFSIYIFDNYLFKETFKLTRKRLELGLKLKIYRYFFDKAFK